MLQLDFVWFLALILFSSSHGLGGLIRNSQLLGSIYLFKGNTFVDHGCFPFCFNAAISFLVFVCCHDQIFQSQILVDFTACIFEFKDDWSLHSLGFSVVTRSLLLGLIVKQGGSFLASISFHLSFVSRPDLLIFEKMFSLEIKLIVQINS